MGSPQVTQRLGCDCPFIAVRRVRGMAVASAIFPYMGQNAIDMQNSGTGAEIAARPLVDKNADTNKPSGIAAAVANGNT